MSEEKRVVLNTTISEPVLSNFRRYCKSINCPMNTILEVFMTQFSNGEFSFKLTKDKITIE